MAKLKSLVLTGNGTNCERETAHACRVGGFDQVDTEMIWDLLAGEVTLADYQLLCLPGGFLDGDDLGAAKAAAIRWRYAETAAGNRLVDELSGFIDGGGLVLGICNGFQLMGKLGLVPATGGFQLDSGQAAQQCSLGLNDSGRFEDRWVELLIDPDSPCVFTRGMERLAVPIRHGEGKVIITDPDVAGVVESKHLAPVRYIDADGTPTEDYPLNPNGSAGGLAGLCDPTGRCFGLMPHPEAFSHKTNHPQWTRLPELPEEGAGMAIFKNAVSYLREA